MNHLQLRYDTSGENVRLRPYIDGVDVLDGYSNSEGCEPNTLLPPLSTRLLPTREGHETIIGVCSCGESGCGSLGISVRRVGPEVVWEPAESGLFETINCSYRFDLLTYLDAVDDAAGNPPAGEGQGRRVARRVQRTLDMYAERYGVLTAFDGARIDWVSAWPWTSATVKASVTSAAGQTVHEFSAGPREPEDQFAARVFERLFALRQASHTDDGGS